MAELKQKSKVKKMYAHMLVDASGSMDAIGAVEITGSINKWIKELQKDKELDVTFSVSVFEGFSGLRHIRKCCNAAEAKFNKGDYETGGSTPLYDAIGQTVRFIDQEVKLTDGEVVSLTIITDGFENASREFKKQNIVDLLKRKQDQDDWFVTYLGANQDGWQEGQSIGVYGMSSASYNVQNFADTVVMASTKTAAFASSGGDRGVSSYTDEDRTDLVKDTPTNPLKDLKKKEESISSSSS